MPEVQGLNFYNFALFKNKFPYQLVAIEVKYPVFDAYVFAVIKG
jgi:hypothetical protein